MPSPLIESYGRLDPRSCAHVLHLTGSSYVTSDGRTVTGHKPGAFMTLLIRAALIADRDNLARIGLGFPAVAAAVDVYRHSEDGVATLAKVVDRNFGHRVTRYSLAISSAHDLSPDAGVAVLRALSEAYRSGASDLDSLVEQMTRLLGYPVPVDLAVDAARSGQEVMRDALADIEAGHAIAVPATILTALNSGGWTALIADIHARFPDPRTEPLENPACES